MPTTAYLHDVLILLVSAVLFAAVFQRAKLGAMLGYLTAGLVVGPYGLALIESPDGAKALAELGVVFLLFNVGLELKIDRLRLIEAKVYALGIAQTAVTAVAIAWVAHAAGVGLEAAVIVGGGLALSSTAVALQVLAQMGAVTSQLGRAALAILLIQDLAVGPLLVLVQVMSQEGASLWVEMLLAVVKACAVLIAVFLFQRNVLRPMLRQIASLQNSDIFMASALLLVLGMAFLTELAGLSLVLGAFLAGLMLADTEYRHQIAADTLPFRGVLLALFFVTVGMSVDVGLAIDEVQTVGLLVFAILAGKTVLTFILAFVLGFAKRRAFRIAMLLSQGGEFAFVLFALATALGVMPLPLSQVLIVSVAITMALAAPLSIVVKQLLDRFDTSRPASPLGNLGGESEELSGHVVVAGFGQVGKAVARHLAGQKIKVLILDLNAKRITESRSKKLPVFYGNAARLDVLREAHLEKALALVVALPDGNSAAKIATIAKEHFPEAWVFARVPDDDVAEQVLKAGAHAVAVDGLTTALELAERVMLVHEPA